MNHGRSISLHRACRLVIAMMPPVATITMTIHVALLLAGLNIPFSEMVVKHSLFDCIMFLIASYAFRFCWVNRAMVLYCYAVSVCIDYQRLHGFGQYLTIARTAVLVAGIILIALFVKRQCWKGL